MFISFKFALRPRASYGKAFGVDEWGGTFCACPLHREGRGQISYNGLFLLLDS